VLGDRNPDESVSLDPGEWVIRSMATRERRVGSATTTEEVRRIASSVGFAARLLEARGRVADGETSRARRQDDVIVLVPNRRRHSSAESRGRMEIAKFTCEKERRPGAEIPTGRSRSCSAYAGE